MKRGKTSFASFSLEDITATVTFLYGLVTQSSSFESSEEPALTYRSHIPQLRAFVGPVMGTTHQVELLDIRAAVLMRPDKDMVWSLWNPVGDSISLGLNEG